MQNNNNEEPISNKTVLTDEVFNAMKLGTKKFTIINMIHEEIKEQGAEGKLIFKALEKGTKDNRRKYYVKAGVFVFEEYISQLNTLPVALMVMEIKIMVSEAKKHFKIV